MVDLTEDTSEKTQTEAEQRLLYLLITLKTPTIITYGLFAFKTDTQVDTEQLNISFFCK